MGSDFEDYKKFEAYMDAVEGNSPQTTLLALLEDAGVELPAPEGLTDPELTALLWRVIHELAELGAYLTSTNHLSDRELYTILRRDTLREDHPIVPEEFPMVTHIDLLGGGSNQDIQTFLKYYADDEERASFAVDGNTSPIPCHEDPPFRRDHLLPHA